MEVGGGDIVTSLDEINLALAPVHARIWPLDLTDLPADLKELLADPAPSPERVEAVKPRFLLSRERLLELIAETGREPHVPGGGELTTLDQTHGVTYPQLYVARADTDYSRFDRLHVNVADDGTPVDDVFQLLCGGGLMVHFQTPPDEMLRVYFDCPSPEAGWMVAVDCGVPFIGSFSGAPVGSKAVTQVFGPARWMMKYLE